MHYVKQFDINGVATKQVACIELHGKPNAATEGCVGVLGIDVDSPRHDVYKCVARNGSIYTWELFSGGGGVLITTISSGGSESAIIPYESLILPDAYTVKVGDLVLDVDGYVYEIDTLYSTYCVATYCGARLGGAEEIEISSTEPTGERVKVWINPEEEDTSGGNEVVVSSEEPMDGDTKIWINPEEEHPKSLFLASSTEGSTKTFEITVDDNGAIRAVEVTG